MKDGIRKMFYLLIRSYYKKVKKLGTELIQGNKRISGILVYFLSTGNDSCMLILVYSFVL